MFQLSTNNPLVCSRSALAIYIYISSPVLQCHKHFDAESITQIGDFAPVRACTSTLEAFVCYLSGWCRSTIQQMMMILKYSGTYGRWRGAHWHLPPTLPPRAVDFWKGRRRQQFCPGASGLCMCACRFLNLIVSFRKNTLLKHEPHSAFRGACYIYSHSLFKTISWWCVFCCLGCSSTNQALHHWQGDCWLGAGSYS